MCATIAKKTSFTIDQANIVIQLAGGLILQGPKELRIEQQINEHAAIFFKARLKEETIEDYQKLIERETAILVSAESTPGNLLDAKCEKLLFRGLATQINVFHDDYGGNDYLEVFGLSYTYLLDRTRERRSFQDQQMPFREMVKAVLAKYPGVYFNMQASLGDKVLGKFTLQQNETVWTFLKRQASVHGHSFLIANAVADHAALNLGIPEDYGNERQLDDHCKLNYTISKTMDDSAATAELERKRLEQKLDDTDRFYFTFEGTNQGYQIADTTTLLGKKLYVGRVIAELRNSVLKYDYTMTTTGGLQYPAFYNEAIVGTTLEGKVKEIKNNHVKVALAIDHPREFTKEEACWFPYATPHTAGGQWGWYFMPEPEDEVQLLFPTNREEQAYVSHAIRTKPTDNTDSPQIKYLRTKDGQEIHFSPDEIAIIASNRKTYIKMTETEVIIESDQAINFNAKGDILIAADGEVNITGKAGAEMRCQGSSVRLLGGVTHLRPSKKLNDHHVEKAEARELLAKSALAGVAALPGGIVKNCGTKPDKKDKEDAVKENDGDMKASDKLIQFIADYEDFSAKSYRGKDAQNETIGYGHVIRKGENLTIVTKEQARDLLERDVEKFEKAVNGLTKGVKLSQQQFDALVSFAYNVGPYKDGLRDSTLLKDVKAGASLETIKTDFEMWVKCNGEKLQGLWRRRVDEWEIYANGDYVRNGNRKAPSGF